MPKGYPKAQQCRDWKFIWATAEGKRALSALFSECGLFSPILGADSQMTAFNEGRRNVALDIVQALSLAPRDFEEVTNIMMETLTDE